jgi:hypothetical protein
MKKKCKCGGKIKRYVICGVNNPKFNPSFGECQKCFKMYK